MQKNISGANNQNDLLKDNKHGIKSNEISDDTIYIFDEPDDELEEFEEMGSIALNVDTDLEKWEEDWGAAGWDDDDEDDDKFIMKVEAELQKFKASLDEEKERKK
ncbi:conserved Plasmodium protein, unknown function [Plasmodium chabaudi chabaudi]|uniref:Uncharacterized protein n=2 Tax=Plasmodium chabaudi TaxID=5825 RepID=A0A077TIZ8_PLACU|nr:conserved Plasmodium protein, unknown function [Plasmodium chabaudi chabaudi]SCM19493.1 conserved Plasmodium protein, unknown function [Plasmodium chabaudi adami]SCM19987.1 conserved Plasmodium protein, unknown function [Plasmodium chabaudi chabaudi]SCN59190.1 conserved Plasmodium protein, unknown function [Plasmodium chabaudi chabaudi]SCN59191.1 conserved Plasmodium protein, unknown function [Plasmodium chabaudi adami]VTZ67806.1 conserved Plasmodium protein, unknown function [Plasmodium ch|eukprot:XP_016653479.1 conserved Plasmodium protein, unknown function [Plasmodium chabaudi chabaudi]